MQLTWPPSQCDRGTLNVLSIATPVSFWVSTTAAKHSCGGTPDDAEQFDTFREKNSVLRLKKVCKKATATSRLSAWMKLHHQEPDASCAQVEWCALLKWTAIQTEHREPPPMCTFYRLHHRDNVSTLVHSGKPSPIP